MTFEDFRTGMDEFWVSVNDRARDLKDPIYALERVASMYRNFDRADRDYANRVFDEWVLGDDEAKRYVAVALIREFRVVTAAPVLGQLAHKLASSDDPGAPFEREKVEGVLAELGDGDAHTA